MTINSSAATTSHADALSALGEALESAADSVGHARADATESAKLAARKVQFGVGAGAYFAAYGVSYGLVFTGVFLKELLPASNPIRRGFEDGAVAARDAAASSIAAFDNIERRALQDEAAIETVTEAE